jgi:hypothetical protein
VNQRSFRAVWEAELDRLELDVVRVERLLSGADDASSAVQGASGRPWSPPAVPGPMPADLFPRARDILERQTRAEGALREALSSAQKQLAYGSRVSDATAPGRAQPVYVDLEA